MKSTAKKTSIIEMIPSADEYSLKEKQKSKDETDSSSESFISKYSDLFTRIGIYSLNIGSDYLSKAFEAKETIGNFYGALGYATLDVLAQKNSKFKRLAKAGGYLFYIGSCGYDLILGLNDFDNIGYHLGNFALDVTMAYQLGKDMRELSKSAKKGEGQKSVIRQDIEEIVSFFKSEKDKESFKVKLKDYFSAFGKGIGQGVSYGALAGYSFGYSAFEELKEKYNNYKAKRKERNAIKKLENEKKKKEKDEQKLREQNEKKINNALGKIRGANKRKMKEREDEINQIKFAGGILKEKGKDKYEI